MFESGRKVVPAARTTPWKLLLPHHHHASHGRFHLSLSLPLSWNVSDFISNWPFLCVTAVVGFLAGYSSSSSRKRTPWWVQQQRRRLDGWTQGRHHGRCSTRVPWVQQQQQKEDHDSIKAS